MNKIKKHLITQELALWREKGNTLLKLPDFKVDDDGEITLLIPFYRGGGHHKVKGFSNYSEALGFFGSLLDETKTVLFVDDFKLSASKSA